ncbi:MAG: helix-hairpin-helix domain-containing protein [Candidatus Velamenicoccus archaeovorus]
MSDGSLRERLSSLSRAELLGLAVVLAVTLGGAALWYLRSLPSPVQVRSSVGAAAAAAASTSPSPEPPAILVDVAGWVRNPGVYEFHEGDRVIDAIEAAGGARDGAMLEGLNLAAPLADGTQVLVPRRLPGQVPGAVAAGAASAGGTPTGGPINVNTATAADLEALSGIGEVLAQRIVDYRTEHGPFASVDDLLDVSGIGDAILADIRDQITV